MNRQALRLQHRNNRQILRLYLTSWACMIQRQQQEQRKAIHTLGRIRLFSVKRILLAWYYSVHNLKLHRLHVQLADRQGSLLQVHQQAQEANKAARELQLERAQLHQRLERVAEHAKIQVGQLAVANDKMQALQQRDADRQVTLEECRTLRASLTEMESLLAHARSGRDQLEAELNKSNTVSTNAAAVADQSHEELQTTCAGLQGHLAGRKATMEACINLLQARKRCVVSSHASYHNAAASTTAVTCLHEGSATKGPT